MPQSARRSWSTIRRSFTGSDWIVGFRMRHLSPCVGEVGSHRSRNLKIRALAAGRDLVDEQAALGNDLLAGLQVALDLDEIPIGEPGRDLTQFNRLVVM